MTNLKEFWNELTDTYLLVLVKGCMIVRVPLTVRLVRAEVFSGNGKWGWQSRYIENLREGRNDQHHMEPIKYRQSHGYLNIRQTH